MYTKENNCEEYGNTITTFNIKLFSHKLPHNAMNNHFFYIRESSDTSKIMAAQSAGLLVNVHDYLTHLYFFICLLMLVLQMAY